MRQENFLEYVFADSDIQNRFTAYVQTALKNTRSTYYSKKKVREERETVFDESGEVYISAPDDVLDTLFLFDLNCLENIPLWKALQTLSRVDRSIIELRVLYEYSFHEIGKMLSMTEGAVKKRYSRAIHALRDLLEDK